MQLTEKGGKGGVVKLGSTIQLRHGYSSLFTGAVYVMGRGGWCVGFLSQLGSSTCARQLLL